MISCKNRILKLEDGNTQENNSIILCPHYFPAVFHTGLDISGLKPKRHRLPLSVFIDRTFTLPIYIHTDIDTNLYLYLPLQVSIIPHYPIHQTLITVMNLHSDHLVSPIHFNRDLSI